MALKPEMLTKKDVAETAQLVADVFLAGEPMARTLIENAKEKDTRAGHRGPGPGPNETKLRSHHERNQLILESSLDGFMVTTIMGDILEVSETYAQRFGYAPEELIGANARDLLVDGQVEAIASDAIHLADGNNIRITVKQRHKDGRILTVEASSTYLNMGDDPQVFTFVRDITEQTEAVEKLYTNEARYRRLVEDMPLLVCRFLSDGTLTFVNDEYCAYFGLTREELLGTSFLARLPKKERKQIDAKLSHLSPKKPTVAYEYLSIGPNGNKRWHHWVDQALFNEQGDLIEYQSVGQDLTEFRQAQQALLQTQKLESLGLMSGGIAHDFNNLLTVILAQGSLAQLIIDEQHQAQPLLKKVVSAAEQAAQLTHQLLAYSGRTQLEKQSIDLNHLINENLSLFDVSRPKSVELVADLGRDLPPIEGDPGQIQQVIMNLIINAYEAIEEGAGRVTVSTNSAEMPPSPSVNGSRQTDYFVPYGNQALPPGKYIELCVQDDGKGMDEQTVARIFDPFFSTKTKGRGLGLAAVLGIIRGHGGGMHVQSAPGMGTTFLIYLPAAPIEPAMPTAISAEVVREPVGGTVLLIDDEAIIRESVCSVLELQHIQTLMAPDGATGLDMLQRHRDEIDLVLLDLSMPGMSGRETLRRLREMDSAVPVILSSGYHDTDMSKEMDALNVTCFLPKPYQANRLLDTIRPILRKKHPA